MVAGQLTVQLGGEAIECGEVVLPPSERLEWVENTSHMAPETKARNAHAGA